MVNLESVFSLFDNGFKSFLFSENGSFKFLKREMNHFFLNTEALPSFNILKKRLNFQSFSLYYFNSNIYSNGGIFIIDRLTGATAIVYSVNINNVYYNRIVTSTDLNIEDLFVKYNNFFNIFETKDIYNDAFDEDNDFICFCANFLGTNSFYQGKKYLSKLELLTIAILRKAYVSNTNFSDELKSFVDNRIDNYFKNKYLNTIHPRSYINYFIFAALRANEKAFYDYDFEYLVPKLYEYILKRIRLNS